MKYTKKRDWCYQVHETCTIKLSRNFGYVDHEYFTINGSEITLKARYSWDGATFAIDTENFIVPSAVHDALFQAMKEGLLSVKYLDDANRELQSLCKKRGMSCLRAWLVYRGVTLAGTKYIKSDIIEVK